MVPILGAKIKIFQRRFSIARWTGTEIPGSSSHFCRSTIFKDQCKMTQTPIDFPPTLIGPRFCNLSESGMALSVVSNTC